jgi:hypothetical protein
MANNQKKLKAFVRYDGSGRVVASSLILRKNKPRVGRWFEIPTYECCNNVPTLLLFNIGESLPQSYPAVTIYCGEANVAYQYVRDDTSLTTVDELVDALNTSEYTRQFGTYSNAGDGNIQLSVPSSVKDLLCPNGELAFTVYPD